MKPAALGVLASLLLAAMPASAGEDTAKVMKALYADYPNKNTPEAAVYRGGIVFSHYCALCHGQQGDGKGRAAKMYDPKPANLIASDKNNQYKELIIRRGGAALGRSQFMPPWNDELTDEQIGDVVVFLHSIQANKP